MLPSLLTALCFALAGISARQSTQRSGPYRANMGRLFIGIFILSAWVMFAWQGMSSTAIGGLAAAGAIGFGLGGFCMMLTLRRLGTPSALLLVESATAVLAGTLAWWWLNDAMTAIQGLACGTILIGVLIAGSAWIGEGQSEHLSERIGGYACGLLAASFQASSLVLSRMVFLQAVETGDSIAKMDAAWVRMVGGAVMACLLLFGTWISLQRRTAQAVVSFQWLRKDQPLFDQPLVWVFLNALAGPVLGVTCWLWAVSLMNPGIVQSIAALAPLISLPIARKLEQEALGKAFFIGAPIAIMGVALLALS